MSGRWVIGLVALGLLAPVTDAVSEQKSPPSARLWLDAGTSHDQAQYRTNAPNGFAVAGGMDIGGRGVAFVLSAAFERYPHADEDGTNVMATAQGPITLRLEGGGNKNVVSLTTGVRFVARHEHLDSYVVASLGRVNVAYDTRRYVDVATNEIFEPSHRHEWSGLIGELGVGARTRRNRNPEGTLVVLWRAYTEGMEGGSGGSMHVRAGLVFERRER